MSRKNFLIITISVILILSFWNSGIFDSIIIFLLTGLLPGLNWSIPPNVMMIGFLAAAWLFFGRSLIEKISSYRYLKKELARKNRMPKKRFSPIQTAK